MNDEVVNVQPDTIRELGRMLADKPMRDLEDMNRPIAALNLSTSDAWAMFGLLLGTSLGSALDEVKLAAQQYLAAKRGELAGIHDKAFDTANQYVNGDVQAADLAAKIPHKGK
jgi:hypothetical protein